jgi:CheY-like chemotaxis protein
MKPNGAAPSDRTSGEPLRILVCDDNVDGANTMALWLRIERYDVRVVHDGPAALATAREWTPEVVLLDLGLTPRMDGFETARRLRRDVGLTAALIVAVTGSDRDEDREGTQEAGFDAHMVKPVEPDMLLAVLAERKRRA